jgi:hypothetical protein
MAGAQCNFMLVILYHKNCTCKTSPELAGSIFGSTIGARFWRQSKHFLILPNNPEATLILLHVILAATASLRFLNRLIN